MRYLHLFLILNIIVCYAGICGDTAHAATSTSQAAESCHEMAGADANDIVLNDSGQENVQDSPCCLDYLTSSSSGEYSNAVFTITEILPVLELHSTNLAIKKVSQDQLLRGHDPPDLQVSYSTFLL